MITTERMIVHGVDLEVLRGGDGDPIVLLHGMSSLTTQSRFPDLLTTHGTVLAPSCPGFGATPRPKDFDTIYDLVHLLRALLDAIPGERITLVGMSFGGWLAAEVAAQGHARLAGLVLVDPVGIKISDRETADILDVFNRSPAEYGAPHGTISIVSPPILTPWRMPRSCATPATGTRFVSTRGILTCTIRNSPGGWAASRYRRWSFGEITTGSFRRTMVAPMPD